MKNLIPTGISRPWAFSAAVLNASALIAFSSCSKTNVHVADDQRPDSALVVQNSAAEKSAADRLVEIEKLLAAAPTGKPDEADRRTALRAERDGLIASGKVPYRNVPQSFTNRVANTPPNNTVTQRLPNGNVINNQVPTQRTEPITVAQDSQAKNLSFLEQMTPSERERYLQTVKAHNTQHVEVEYRRR
jgi:peptidoglycan hydrolase-like protein with peptidoglycan-binding domain